jgi:hypothetical protein
MCSSTHTLLCWVGKGGCPLLRIGQCACCLIRCSMCTLRSTCVCTLWRCKGGCSMPSSMYTAGAAAAAAAVVTPLKHRGQPDLQQCVREWHWALSRRAAGLLVNIHVCRGIRVHTCLYTRPACLRAGSCLLVVQGQSGKSPVQLESGAKHRCWLRHTGTLKTLELPWLAMVGQTWWNWLHFISPKCQA